MVDLGALEWWQGVAAILGVLGLSPAPWILGLAVGRIQFSKPSEAAYEARIAELKARHDAALSEITQHHAALLGVKDAQYEELKKSRDYYRDARLVEKDRADKATEQVLEALEVTKTAVYVLQSLDEATKTGGPE